MADAATLLSLSDHIHLVLIKTDPSGDTTLIGSHFLAWRDILSSTNGRLTSAVEINGVGAEAKVPMGILEIKFEIIPRFSQVKLFVYKMLFIHGRRLKVSLNPSNQSNTSVIRHIVNPLLGFPQNE